MSRPRVIWTISIRTTLEAEDAVTELFSAVFGQPAVTHINTETRAATVSLFCQTRPGPLRVERNRLRQGLARLKACGLKIGTGRVRVCRIRRQNWAESWKRHFKPLTIGDTLLLKPSWSRRHARRGQKLVVLDPGLSFGTGQHPTTAFCLRELVRRRTPGTPQSFLDLGTGSGILAIAAAKLGYRPVHALDADPESVRAARANARANRVLDRVRIALKDLARLPLAAVERYDVVCANLISTLLVAERRRIAGRLKRGGALIVAGVLRSEFPEVREAYQSLGLHLTAVRSEKEWRSGTFV